MHNMIKSILGFGALAAVYATPVTFTDIVNPSNDVKITDGGQVETYTYTHNIVDNGFNSATDLITSADIDISLGDDDGDIWWLGGATETVRIRLDNVTQGNAFEVNTGIYTFNVMTQFLQTDGTLTVSLEAVSGDFNFRESRLDVYANRTAPVAAVPEPGSMALMGLGMLGLGFAARRKIKA
jgi:PEP-CTERM motif-containing protein